MHSFFPHLLFSSAIGSDKKCNGVPGLCDLSLNDVTFPATHKSGAYNLDHGNLNVYQPLMEIREELATSQSLTFRQQLEAGVRALDIEPCCANHENLTTVSHTRAKITLSLQLPTKNDILNGPGEGFPKWFLHFAEEELLFFFHKILL